MVITNDTLVLLMMIMIALLNGHINLLVNPVFGKVPPVEG
jgi:hypothetical protein